MNTNNTTWLFRFLKRMGLLGDTHKYGNITIWGLFSLFFNTIWRRIIFNYSYKNLLFEPINKKKLRPRIWRALGCKVGKNVMIGHAVRLDFGNASLIEIKDDVVISNNTTILCHKRDVSNYKSGDKANELPFVYEKVTIGKGCQIGLNCTILPGVTIGDGAIIGSASVVVKDIPAWSIAVGNPAKVIRYLNNA